MPAISATCYLFVEQGNKGKKLNLTLRGQAINAVLCLSMVLVLNLLFLAIADSGVELVVLGVAQDAGYPQAGCYEPRCLPAWENANLRQGPTSLAVVDQTNDATILFEATPNLPEQLFQLEQFAPSAQLNGVFLTHAHIGHYTGLMYFGHEVQGAKGMPVYAMPRMKNFLETNGPWSQFCLLYTSPSPRDGATSRMPSSA